MRIIRCPSCGMTLNSVANICSNCGINLNLVPKARFPWMLLLPFTVAGFCLITCLGHFAPSKPDTEDDKEMAFASAEVEVQDQLISPDNVEFINSQNQVHPLGNHQYMLTSEVLAQNAFGVRMRTPWRAWVHFEIRTGWVVDRVQIVN